MLSQEVNAEGEKRTREKERKREREGEREGYINQHLCFIKKL